MRTLVDCMQHAAESEHVGITFIRSGSTEDFLSYAALHRLSLRVLHNLLARGCKTGEEIILLIEDPAAFLPSFWACVQGGMIPVPIATGKQAEHERKLANICAQLGRPWIITGSETPVTADARVIMYAEICVDNGAAQPRPADAGELAFIQYSSGSTSTPKGVMLTHDNLLANASDIIKGSGTTARDAALCWMPLTHDMGLIGFHITCLLAGIPQYIIPTPVFIKRPSLWLEMASKHKVTQLYSPNFGFHYVLSFSDAATLASLDLSAVRIIYNGAEPISIPVCEKFLSALGHTGLRRSAMLPVYGLAEASVAVSIPDLRQPFRSFCLNRKKLKPGDAVEILPPAAGDGSMFVGVGMPLSQCSIRICNEKDEPLPDGVAGHIQIRGRNVTRGYYKDAAQTAKAFTHDGWLRTSDLGLLLGGMLVITGRSKNIVIINGQNYYYHDIEHLVVEKTGIGFGKVFACGLANEGSEEELLVFVLHKGDPQAFASIGAAVRETVLQHLGIPVSKVIPIKKVPKTTSGKTQYFRLIEAFRAGIYDEALRELEQHAATGGAAGSVEAKIMECLRQAMPGQDLSAGDIWKQGLNSISAIRLAAALRHAFGCPVDIAMLFGCGSLQELTACITSRLSFVDAQKDDAIAATTATDIRRASPGQQRFFILNSDPAFAKALVICWCYSLRGPLDRSALRTALGHLVAKYEILRTRFAVRDGEIVQVIHNEAPDFATEGSADAQANTVFDLEKDRLLRVRLLQQPDGSHLLVFAAHHSILDGWSLPLLAKELSSLYNDPSQAATRPPRQYGDLVEAQHLQLMQPSAAASLAHWAQVAGKDFTLPALPFDGRQNMRNGIFFERSTLHFDKALQQQLDAFTLRHRITKFTTLAATLFLLLYKYTGRRDQLIGVNFAGRTHEESFGQPGLFTNTLPLRCTPRDHCTFLELAEQFRQEMALAFRHQLPFETILKHLADNGIIQDHALFNVLFIHQYFTSDINLQLQGVESAIRQHAAMNRHGFTDLQLEAIEMPGELHIELKYNASKIEAGQALSMLNHFQLLLAQVLEDPQRLLSELSVISPQEQDRLLRVFNDTAAAYPEGTLPALLSSAALVHAGATALRCGDAQLTYAALHEASGRLCRYLMNRYHAGKGARAGICMQRSEKSVITLLAILRSGAAYVPIDADWPQERKSFVAHDCRLSFIICDAATAGGFESANLPEALIYEEAAAAALGLDPAPLPPIHAADIAYVLYTSGTTGGPKGVLVTHGNLYDYVQTFMAYYKVGHRDRVIHQSSLSFDLVVEELFPVLCAGGCLVVFTEGSAHVGKLAALIQRERVTIATTTPVIVSHLNEQAGALTSLRALISGGEALRPEHFDELLGKVPLYNTYGPTETTVCATYRRIRSAGDAVRIGKPIANRSIYILNEQLLPVPAGVTGELFIGGKGVAAGYLNKPELTAEKFITIKSAIANLPSEIICYRTGDRGYWTEDGEVIFTGRTDDQVKLLGHRIETGEIENCLLQLEGIDNAAVIVQEDKGQKHLVACYTMPPGSQPVEPARFLRSRLPRQMVPARFVQLDIMPLNSSGKTDRRALVRMVQNSAKETTALAGSLEKRLAALWQEVLKVSEVHADDNFFGLGGQSIKAVQLLSRIRQDFGADIGIGQLYHNPTVRELASLLRAAEPTATSVEYEVPDVAQHELSRAQHGLWMAHQLSGSTARFNISGAYHLTGLLGIAALRKAFDDMVARHEILRTSFIHIKGEPRQLVHHTIGFSLAHHDLTADAGREEKLAQLVRDTAMQEFDLDGHTLMRAGLVTMEPGRAVLLLCFHHLIADGISALNFADELLRLYRYHAGYDALKPAPPDGQYKTFVYWQKAMQPVLQRHSQAFWHQYLQDAPAGVRLPYDHPRQDVKDHAGATLDCFIPEEHAALLEALCRRQGITLFTLFLAALNILLYKLCHADDIVIGSPWSGRSLRMFDKQLGLFANPLVFRSSVRGDDTIESVLAAAAGNVAAVLQHRDYPYDQLLAGMQDLRGQYAQSLFNIRYIWDEGDILLNDFERQIPVTDVLSFRQLAYYPPVSLYDISFIFSRQRQIKVSLQYSTALFEAETIELMRDRLLRLLECMALQPHLPVKDIDLRMEAEVRRDAAVAAMLEEEESF